MVDERRNSITAEQVGCALTVRRTRHAGGLQALLQDKKAKYYTIEEIIEGGYNLDLCCFPYAKDEILEPLELIGTYQERRDALTAEIGHVLGKIMGILERKQKTQGT